MIFLSFEHFLEFLNYFKSRKLLTASALRHAGISRSMGLSRVKPDMWGPQVSDTGLVSVADWWAWTTATSAESMLTGGSHYL